MGPCPVFLLFILFRGEGPWPLVLARVYNGATRPIFVLIIFCLAGEDLLLLLVRAKLEQNSIEELKFPNVLFEKVISTFFLKLI